MSEEEAAVRWGTWEELVLGGAVLRHGTRAWETIASELRARITLYACAFTPQECEVKYEDLRERYCGCTAWFEELRKQRVAELKKELEKSEESIGSLQSKLESLISDREGKSNTDCDADSNVPIQNVGVECPGKQNSKDGLSAGSFTEDAMRDCSTPETRVPEVRYMEENETKVDAPQLEREKAGSLNLEVGRLSVKKRRGKRRRKGCEEAKEGSESDMLSSVNVDKEKEGSSEGCNETFANSHQMSGLCDGKEVADLAGIMNSYMAHEDVSIFRRRLESQKRVRYKKMIRRHVDFGTIQSSIEHGTISTTKELYRDLLLLSNNAFLFYPKNSSEYKAALTVRDAATQRLRHTSFRKDTSRDSTSITSAIRDSSSISSAALESDGLNKGLLSAAKTIHNPVKPRSMRPCNRKVSGKAVPKAARSLALNSGKGNSGKLPSGGGSTAKLSTESIARKGNGRPGKRGKEAAQKTADVLAIQGRKRARGR